MFVPHILKPNFFSYCKLMKHNSWEHKYLKYKKKYLSLKNQSGGGTCPPKIIDKLWNLFSTSSQEQIFPTQIIVQQCFLNSNETIDFNQFTLDYFNNDNKFIIFNRDLIFFNARV